MRPFDASGEAAARRAGEFAAAAENWLDLAAAQAAEIRAGRWQPDCRDAETYLASVEPVRRRLRQALRLDPEPAAGGGVVTREPVGRLGSFEVVQLGWQPWAGLRCGALRIVSGDGPRPTVVAFGDLSDEPERICGLSGPSPTAGVIAGLLRAGIDVVLPRLAVGWPARMRLARRARLVGREWVGIELLATVRLIDLLRSAGCDAFAAWGFGRGGQTAMGLAALDDRIAALGVGGWFTDRSAKLLRGDDPRQPGFLESPEADQFIPGWLLDVSDVELAGLAAPDPLQVTCGLDDPVIDFEQAERCFGQVAAIYAALGRSEACELVLHPGGHTPPAAEIVAFFARWLEAAVPVGLPEPAVPLGQPVVMPAAQPPRGRSRQVPWARRQRRRLAGRRGVTGDARRRR